MSIRDYRTFADLVVQQFPAAPPAPKIRRAPGTRGESTGGRPRKAPGEMTRHVPTGDYGRVCPWCRRDFRTARCRCVYCSDACEVAAQNARTYRKRKNRA